MARFDIHDFTPSGLVPNLNFWLGEGGVLVSQFRDKFITIYKRNERREKIDPVTNIEGGSVIYLFKDEEMRFLLDNEEGILEFLRVGRRGIMESL
ncbi:MAG: hypothetical protein KKB46_04235 [Candidatus Omnitrophica bacterium]|nr:hypothetical protein [Candidatus Omnitrophota bacterium]